MRRLIFYTTGFLLLFSCQVETDKNTNIATAYEKKEREVAESRLADIEEGEHIFKQKCSICHPIYVRDGFDLGFWNRTPGETSREKYNWLKGYLSNADSMITAGDLYVESLKAEYNSQNQKHHELIKLTDKELLALILFSKSH